MMAFNRTNNLSNLSKEDEWYLNQQLSPHSRPLDLFTTKGADPLPGNWPYDSAIDLFSLTPADMDSAPFDFVDGLTNTDIKDLFIDPFAPTAFSGLPKPTAKDTVSSSDLESDDQSWSTGMRQSIDIDIPKQPSPTDKPLKPTTHNSSSHSATSSTRWSSSPEIKPQEYIAPKSKKSATSSSGRKTRSYSQDSTRSSMSQDPQTRNSAKRAAHNIIEKRYRTNMNAKLLALEKAISPASVQKQSSRPGAGPGSLKKSEILTNALAYIDNVQQDNQALRKELALLKQGLLPRGMWRYAK